MTWPATITMPPFRAEALAHFGVDELGCYCWRIVRGTGAEDDVTREVLGGTRWTTAEHAAVLIERAAQRARAAAYRVVEDVLAPFDASIACMPNPQTRASLRGALRVLRSDALVGTPIHRVDRDALHAARDRLLQRYAPRTVQRYLRVLAAAWHRIERDGVELPAWPGFSVVVYDVRPKPVPDLAHTAALLVVLVEADDWRVVAFLLLVETGARRSEVATLRLEDCDLEGGTIRVRGKRTARGGPTATRAVPLHPDGRALAALQRWCRDRAPGPLWPTPTGRALDGALRDAARQAGLRPMAPGAWRRLADCRLIDAGRLKELPAIMDHELDQAMSAYVRPEAPQVVAAVAALKAP